MFRHKHLTLCLEQGPQKLTIILQILTSTIPTIAGFLTFAGYWSISGEFRF